MNTTELQNIVEFFQLHNCVVVADDTLNPKQVQYLNDYYSARKSEHAQAATREGHNGFAFRVIPLWAAVKSYRYCMSYSRIQYWKTEGSVVSVIDTE